MKVLRLFFALLVVALVYTIAFMAPYKFSGRFSELEKICFRHFSSDGYWKEGVR